MDEKRALVRRPSPRLAEGLVTHIERTSVDLALAAEQWRGYVAALDTAGWRILEAPAVDECPDGVFVEDTMVVYRDLAVISRPGAPSRRAETQGAQDAVRAAGYRLGHIRSPGTLDGGDVLKVGDVVYVGLGGRTNRSGFAQLGELLTPMGARLISVPVTKVLHLKSAVTALPDGCIVGYPPNVDDTGVFDSFLPVPEESGSHVVLLDDTRVLMASSAPRTADLLTANGLDVVTVDISEFERLEGCVTCLSVRLRGWTRPS